MQPLHEYLTKHIERGACLCGSCGDAPANPGQHQPAGHTADLIFFKVSAKGKPTADKLRELVKAHEGSHCECDLLDGKEHCYLEVGGWIGDQGMALSLMGLGSLLGLWKLLTPYSVLGAQCDPALAMTMAKQGYVAVMAPKTS